MRGNDTMMTREELQVENAQLRDEIRRLQIEIQMLKEGIVRATMDRYNVR